ncbi:MAG: ParA family protein [Eubacteriales bacterium]|nr:ParA family protein [Eubacteriales bacterium]MDD3882403.1 ParA family protein [Eubacteriales bacterium]MDD4512376.1 ParA family protein [Eubacteriales bacterium]
MGKIIAVANQKGGVGKTTTCVSVASSIAALGKRVLLVDLDPQGNASSGLGAKLGQNCVYEAMMGQISLGDVISDTPMKGLSIIPSDIRLAGAEVELVSSKKREFILRGLLAAIAADYDYIFIDCQPSLGILTINALTAARSVLVPIQCEYYALEGVTSLMNTINRVKRSLNPLLELEGVVMTMYDSRTNLSAQVVSQVRKHFREKVFDSVIPRNVRLSESPSHGLPICLYDKNSSGALAYSALASEILKRNGQGSV